MLQDVEMTRLTNRRIAGGALKKLRFELALTQGELGQRIGLSEIRVRQLENSIDGGVQPRVWRKLMELLGKTLPETETLLAIPAPEEDELPDANVEPYSEREVPEIPLFDMPIAAGVMTPIPEVEEHDERQRLVMQHKRFRVRIRGESMEPEYANESIVEFICLQFRPDGTVAGMEVGKDYYVQAAEEATFKRLKAITDEDLVFLAVNRRKFPKDIRVRRCDVNRMAKAVAVITLKG